jgi:F-type H+-transporting ATPase subunit epsilon
MPVAFHLDIVSAEEEIFSGFVQKLFVGGVMGDLEILNNHAPLLTTINPGPVSIVKEDGAPDVFYISGGVLVVDPHLTTILADTAVRAKDLDEAEALEAKKRAEQVLSLKKQDFDYAEAESELIEAIGRLKTLKKARDTLKDMKDPYDKS